MIIIPEESFFSKSTSLLIASTPFSSFATSIAEEERILFYDKKTSSNDKIRLGLLTMSSRTF
jgi:hypothetical protein